MTWTTEKPTEPGWYWYRDEDGLFVMQVGPYKDGMVASWPGHDCQVAELDGEWLGPLVPPTPQEDAP